MTGNEQDQKRNHNLDLVVAMGIRQAISSSAGGAIVGTSIAGSLGAIIGALVGAGIGGILFANRLHEDKNIEVKEVNG